jgi:hypothetical protein
MTACEKCWADAYRRMLCEPSKSQTEHYMDLLDERKGSPCSQQEQSGNSPDRDERTG